MPIVTKLTKELYTSDLGRPFYKFRILELV